MVAASAEVSRGAQRGGHLRRGGTGRTSLLVTFISVPVLLYTAFVIWPMVQAVAYSLTNWSGFSSNFSFVGMANYVGLAFDDDFRTAVGNNLVMLLILPLVTLAIGFALAIMVTIGGSSRGAIQGVRGAGFYRVAAFFPGVIPSIIVGVIFAQIYDPNSGILNGLLTGIGFEQFTSFAWLGEESTAMGATIATFVWASSGFYMILFVAGIRGIDTELFDAAKMDGAGRFRTAISVVLPGIFGNVKSSYIFVGIHALDMFVYLQALNPSGGPRKSTLGMTQQIYTTAFTEGRFGIACAMGVVLTAITFGFVWLVGLLDRVVSR